MFNKSPKKAAEDRVSSPNVAYEKSRDLAQKALDLADRHLTPPMPKAYEVLYEYAHGKNREVVAQIDTIINESGSLDTYDIGQVYDLHFSYNEKQRRQNDKANEAMKCELDAIIDLIRIHASSSDEYRCTLDDTLKDLSIDVSPQQLKIIIKSLLSDNERMQKETVLLTDKLETSKAQMQQINKELDEARKTALTDPVTDIGNRHWLTYKIEESLEKSKATNEQFCLIFSDIDHFKRVNDTFGHSTGDQVLRFFGALLKKHLEDAELCARFGGEEFVAIVPNPNLAFARKLAENIRKELEKSELVLSVSKKPLGKITASFGIAKSRAGDDFSSILERADKQLYAAKDGGRNRVLCED